MIFLRRENEFILKQLENSKQELERTKNESEER